MERDVVPEGFNLDDMIILAIKMQGKCPCDGCNSQNMAGKSPCREVWR